MLNFVPSHLLRDHLKLCLIPGGTLFYHITLSERSFQEGKEKGRESDGVDKSKTLKAETGLDLQFKVFTTLVLFCLL